MASHSILKLIGEGGESRRRSIRNRVLMVATLHTSSREIAVRLRDVSATGARIEGAELPRPGADVILKRGAFEGFARVVWTSGNVAGIEFDEPIEETELMLRLNGLPPASAPDPDQFRRPGFGHKQQHPSLSNGRGWVGAPRRV
ncbi:PilZ domain-containing protein [Sphingosinicella sp. YJ22]|uniref:PilZ domain-containing protein n=1 Tax=Sphingosinicella sp. YJ22 TaxID=1104780 RepID=UPI0014084127|nr:PilZ domain-containing protein [Sphingosinicella sp. YJ22]